jgi:hypothetical protein
MSSPGYGALTVEWPSWLLADRLTVALAAAAAAVVESVLANHPDVPSGLGLGLGALLIGAQLWRMRNTRTTVGARLDPLGRWTLLTRGGREPAELAPGSRVLGATVVLRLRAAGGIRQFWLTERDVPPSRLRELRVRLLAAGDRAKA